MSRFKMGLTMVTVALTMFVVSSAGAQETIDSQWAQQFLGAWDVALTTPDGQLPIIVTVRENAGAVVIVLGNGDAAAPPITNVRRNGDALIARYAMDYQGMPIDAVLRMRREADALATEWSFADGAFETSARGVKR